ncbi:MAG: hypothetical protein JNM93_01255 [Bacteriovoracaceae bacterium]|nr:hypothetical protein [Bacteriovoracaceae bacterium]
MKKRNLLKISLVLVPCFIASAQTARVIPGTVPTEFQLLIDSVNDSPSKPLVYGSAKQINTNLAFATKKNVFFIMKSEIYKTVLDFEYDKYTPNIQLGPSLYSAAEEKYQKNKSVYSSFSSWIIRSLLSDLKFRIETQKGLEDIVEGKYLRPWFKNIMSYSPKDFNLMTSRIASLSLLRITNMSGIIKNQTVIDEKTSATMYFEIQDGPSNKVNTPPPAPKTEEMLKNIIPTQEIIDLELDEINKAIGTQSSPEWKPKNNGLPAPLDENADATPLEKSDWKPKAR